LTCAAQQGRHHMKLERMLQQLWLHAAVVLLLLVTGGCVLSSTSSNSYSSVELPVSDWKIVNSSEYSLGLSCCTYVFERCRFVLAFSTPGVFRTCIFHPPVLSFSVLAFSVASLLDRLHSPPRRLPLEIAIAYSCLLVKVKS